MNRCRHYAIKGHCKLGDSCSFSHEGKPGDMSHDEFVAAGGSAPPPIAPTYTTPAAVYSSYPPTPTLYSPPYTTPYSSPVPYSSTYPPPTAPRRGSVPCRHHQRGSCRLGDKCGFAHEGPRGGGGGGGGSSGERVKYTPTPVHIAAPSTEVVEKAKLAAENAAKVISASLAKKTAS